LIPRLLTQSLTAATRTPAVVLGVLAMIVGYHFWGVLGVFLAFAAVILWTVLAARRRASDDERQRLAALRSREALEPK